MNKNVEQIQAEYNILESMITGRPIREIEKRLVPKVSVDTNAAKTKANVFEATKLASKGNKTTGAKIVESKTIAAKRLDNQTVDAKVTDAKIVEATNIVSATRIVEATRLVTAKRVIESRGNEKYIPKTRDLSFFRKYENFIKDTMKKLDEIASKNKLDMDATYGHFIDMLEQKFGGAIADIFDSLWSADALHYYSNDNTSGVTQLIDEFDDIKATITTELANMDSLGSIVTRQRNK